MDPTLQVHRPTERARQQAEAAGLDLEALKASDPKRYKLLNAEAVATIHPAMLELAGNVFFAAFRHHDLFQLPAGAAGVELHSFPALSAAERARLGDALARLAALEPFAGQHAFYRVVSDRRGEHRQLGLPTPPQAWQGEADVLVGPFADQAEADAWGEARVGPASGLLYDAVARGGAWFCDVFSAGLD